MGGWHLRMTWDQEVCYASLHSEPASALGLPTVWSLWGNPGMARCREMSTLHAGYILQHKVTSASSSGSLGFIMNFHCVWSVAGWLIVYQDGDYLYLGQYSQTICRSQYVMIPPSGREHYSVHSWKAGPDCGKLSLSTKALESVFGKIDGRCLIPRTLKNHSTSLKINKS